VGSAGAAGGVVAGAALGGGGGGDEGIWARRAGSKILIWGLAGIRLMVYLDQTLNFTYNGFGAKIQQQKRAKRSFALFNLPRLPKL